LVDKKLITQVPINNETRKEVPKNGQRLWQEDKRD